MIKVGHAKQQSAGYVVYCGRTFGGFRNIGLGNPFPASDVEWPTKYEAWLRAQYKQNEAVRMLLWDLACRHRQGEVLVLKCWCIKGDVQWQPGDAVVCHTQIVAKIIHVLANI